MDGESQSAKMSFHGRRAFPSRRSALAFGGALLANLLMVPSVRSSNIPFRSRPIDPETARVIVMLGRLKLDPTQFKVSKFQEVIEPSSQSKPSESNRITLDVTVSYHHQEPTLHVMIQEPRARLFARFSEGDEVAIEAWVQDEVPFSIDYRQSDGKRIVCRAAEVNGRSLWNWEGKSLWHMWAEFPAEADRWLKPILEWVAPEWDPRAMLPFIQQRIREDRTSPAIDWMGIVNNLSSKSARDRDRAWSALHEASLPDLQEIDRILADPALQAEAANRLQIVRNRILPHSEDNPMQVSLWCRFDPQMRRWAGALPVRDQSRDS